MVAGGHMSTYLKSSLMKSISQVFIYKVNSSNTLMCDLESMDTTSSDQHCNDRWTYKTYTC